MATNVPIFSIVIVKSIETSSTPIKTLDYEYKIDSSVDYLLPFMPGTWVDHVTSHQAPDSLESHSHM